MNNEGTRLAAMILAASMASSTEHLQLMRPVGRALKPAAVEKKCRVCGKTHTHHNLYCSPECCRGDK